MRARRMHDTLTNGRPTVHVAGPRVAIERFGEPTVYRQTCERCGVLLPRQGGLQAWPEGALIERGPGYMALVLSGADHPLCDEDVDRSDTDEAQAEFERTEDQ